MRHTRWALAALVMSACAPPPEQSETASVPPIDALGCSAQTSRDWSAVGSQYYVIEAEARGATCADAVATLRIKSVEGAIIYTRDHPTRETPLAFNPNSDQTGLRAELDAWIQNTADPATVDTLPAWPSGGLRPPGFRPSVTRSRYEEARGAQGPLFCYPDGAESNACIAMAGNAATPLGSLTPEDP